MKYILAALITLSSIQNLLAQEVIEVAPVEEVMIMEEEAPKGVGTFNQNGLVGVKNYTTNAIIIPAEYQSIELVDADIFIVKKNAYGVFNSALNKLVLPMEFERVSFLHRKEHYQFNDSTQFVIVVKKEGKYGLMDQGYRYLMNCEYDKMESSSKYIILGKGGKSGAWFLDRRSKDIPVIYDKLVDPYGTRHLVANLGERYFLFDEIGKRIVENCRQISMYRDRSQQRVDNRMLVVNEDGKCGIYDTRNNAYLINVKYEAITDGFEDHFVVRKKSRYGVVAKDDKTVIPLTYDSLAFLFPRSLKSPLLAARGKKFGLVDLTNKVVADFQYDDLQNINGLFKAKKQGKYTVLDNSGKAITSSVFDDVGSLFYGQMAVFNDGKFGYIDASGKVTTPIERPSPARGYKDVNELFKGFEKAIKTESDSVMMEFCRDVVYDAYTQEFFLRIRYQYRGFPNMMIQKNFTVEDVAKDYFKAVSNFYQRLKESGQLQSFEFERLENPGFDYFDRSKELRGTETWGVFKTNARTFQIKLGELIDCDGYWKSFTNFRWSN